MKVFHGIGQAGRLEGLSLCLGNFDGVHRGHQALFREAQALAPAAVLTFEPHPGKVLQPALAPKLITPLHRKLELFEAYGLSAVVVQPFSQVYAQTTPEGFEHALLEDLKVKHLVVGVDFTYGQLRQGTVETLARSCAARGALLHVVSPVTVEGVVASSSKVREYILEGRVSAAQTLMGRPFDLDGVVVPGLGRGRGIGFPTANVETQNELRPGAGVYAVRVRLEGETPWRGGAANIGVKPTFGDSELTLEVHLFDFAGDLYRKKLRVQFLERLRPEQRFNSVGELVGQIHRDVESARAVVAQAGE